MCAIVLKKNGIHVKYKNLVYVLNGIQKKKHDKIIDCSQSLVMSNNECEEFDIKFFFEIKKD